MEWGGRAPPCSQVSSRPLPQGISEIPFFGDQLLFLPAPRGFLETTPSAVLQPGEISTHPWHTPSRCPSHRHRGHRRL